MTPQTPNLDNGLDKILAQAELPRLVAGNLKSDLLQWRDKAVLEARIEGASIAAQEINQELGLEMTINGNYYLAALNSKEEG